MTGEYNVISCVIFVIFSSEIELNRIRIPELLLLLLQVSGMTDLGNLNVNTVVKDIQEIVD